MMQLNEPERQRLINLALEYREEGRGWRERELRKRAQRNYNYFIGNHWAGRKLASWKAKPVENHCSRIVRYFLPRLTDAKPKMEIEPREPNDYPRADVANQLLQFKAEELALDVKANVNWLYDLIFGLAWYKPLFNPRLRKGMGDVDVDVPDSWYVMPDPNTSWSSSPLEAMQKARHVTHEYPDSLRNVQDWIKALAKDPAIAQQAGLLPGALQYVTDLSAGSSNTTQVAAPWTREELAATGGVAIENVPMSGGGGSHKIYVNYGSGSLSQADQTVTRSEVWFRANGYEPIIVVTFIDDHPVQIRENPHAHGEFPFLPTICHPLPGRLAGFGVFDDILPLQDDLNKRLGQIMDIMNFFKSPVTVSDGNVKVTWSPGAHIEIGAGRMFKVESPPPVPADLWRSISDMRQAIDQIAGVQMYEMKAGVAGVAIEQVMESNLLIVRQIERLNTATLQEMYRQLFANMQQLYAHEPQYAMQVAGEKGRTVQVFDTADIMGRFDLRFTPNMAYTMKRQVYMKQLMDMKGAGAPIPWDIVADSSDVPDKEGLKAAMKAEEARIMQEQMQQQQMAMAAQGQPPQPGQGGQ